MKLLTKEIENLFVKQGDTSEKQANEIKVICKWFNPVGAGTWYVYERFADDPDIFMCYANLGDPTFAECGTVSLSELEKVGLPFGLSIERDRFFKANEYTLQEIIDKVQAGEHV